jgi:hypothetical protein
VLQLFGAHGSCSPACSSREEGRGSPAWAWRGGSARRKGARSTAYSGLTVMERASRHEDGDDHNSKGADPMARRR